MRKENPALYEKWLKSQQGSVSLSDPGRIQKLREQFGYTPRLGEIGGTTYREEAFTNFEGVDVNSNLTFKRLETVTKLHSHLQNVRFLLVRSPPMSGKTSLAQLYENYLLNTHNELRIFRISLIWLRKESDWDFTRQFEYYMGGVSWDTFVHECDKIQTILIMDEIQVLYKPEVKRVLQGGSLHIVAFASYGYRGAYSGPGYLKTISPFDLDEINTWNFEDVRYTEQEYADFFSVFCRSNLKLVPEGDVPRLANYVKEATKCHPGLISFVLNDIVLRFRQQGVKRTRACHDVIAISEEEQQLIDKVLFKPGGIDTRSAVADRLIKTNVLSDFRQGYQLRNRKLDFTSPLVRAAYLQERLGSRTRVHTLTNTFEDFIKKAFKLMSPETFKKTLCMGRDDVGAVFASEGWVDFYVDDDHDWMIELVRDGENLEKHREKMKEDGLYGSILKCAKHHAIVDIRSGVGRPRNLKSGVIYVVCSQDFSSVEICINSSWDKVRLCGSGDLYTEL
ncbi:6105_t:CDS:2, partial [Paraglomus occultum]